MSDGKEHEREILRIKLLPDGSVNIRCEATGFADPGKWGDVLAHLIATIASEGGATRAFTRDGAPVTARDIRGRIWAELTEALAQHRGD